MASIDPKMFPHVLAATISFTPRPTLLGLRTPSGIVASPTPSQTHHVVLVTDPYTCDVTALTPSFEEYYPPPRRVRRSEVFEIDPEPEFDPILALPDLSTSPCTSPGSSAPPTPTSPRPYSPVAWPPLEPCLPDLPLSRRTTLLRRTSLRRPSTPHASGTLVEHARVVDISFCEGSPRLPLLARPHTVRLGVGAGGAGLAALPSAPVCVVAVRRAEGVVGLPVREGVRRAVLVLMPGSGVGRVRFECARMPGSVSELVVHLARREGAGVGGLVRRVTRRGGGCGFEGVLPAVAELAAEWPGVCVTVVGARLGEMAVDGGVLDGVRVVSRKEYRLSVDEWEWRLETEGLES